MPPLHYGVLTFKKFFIHFPEESEESSSTADRCSDLKCDEGKGFRRTEETTEKLASTEAKISKHITALQCFDVF
jgi:hypothetical protein